MVDRSDTAEIIYQKGWMFLTLVTPNLTSRWNWDNGIHFVSVLP